MLIIVALKQKYDTLLISSLFRLFALCEYLCWNIL